MILVRWEGSGWSESPSVPVTKEQQRMLPLLLPQPSFRSLKEANIAFCQPIFGVAVAGIYQEEVTQRMGLHAWAKTPSCVSEQGTF